MPTEHLATAIESEKYVGPELRYQILGGTVLAGVNMVAAVSQLGVAIVRKAAAGVLDATHNIFDGPAYFKQFRLIANTSAYERPPQKRRGWDRARRFMARKAPIDSEESAAAVERSSYAWIAMPALGSMALAGYGLAHEIINPSEHNSVSTGDYVHMGSAGLALMIAGGLLGVGKSMKRNLDEPQSTPRLRRYITDLHSHAKLDVASSAAAVVESVAHASNTGVWAINAGVMAIAGYQAWRFWPSRLQKDAENSHHAHGHEHTHCDHVHLVPHEIAEKSSRLLGTRHRKTVALVGVMAAALGFGLAADTTAQEAARPAAVGVDPGYIPDFSLPRPTPKDEHRAPANRITLFECVQAERADSQWKIARQRITDSTHKIPTRSAINAVTLLMSYENRRSNPEPDKVRVGQCVRTPTKPVARRIYEAVTEAYAQESQVGPLLLQLNGNTTYDKAMQDHAMQREIRFSLQNVASS